MELHSRHVGNDAVLKGTFKPYLTTNAAAPLFQTILEEGGGGNECKSVCRGHLDVERGSQLLLHTLRRTEPASVSAHSVGSSAWWWAYTVENALSIIR